MSLKITNNNLKNSYKKQNKIKIRIENASPALQSFVLNHPEYGLSINQNTSATGKQSEEIILIIPRGIRSKEEFTQLFKYLSANDQQAVAASYTQNFYKSSPEFNRNSEEPKPVQNKPKQKQPEKYTFDENFRKEAEQFWRQQELANAEKIINPELPQQEKKVQIDFPFSGKLTGEYAAHRNKVYSLLSFSKNRGEGIKGTFGRLEKQINDYLQSKIGLRRWYLLGLVKTTPSEAEKIELIYYLCRLARRAEQDTAYGTTGIDYAAEAKPMYSFLEKTLTNLPAPYHEYPQKIEELYGHSLSDWKTDPN